MIGNQGINEQYWYMNICWHQFKHWWTWTVNHRKARILLFYSNIPPLPSAHTYTQLTHYIPYVDLQQMHIDCQKQTRQGPADTGMSKTDLPLYYWHRSGWWRQKITLSLKSSQMVINEWREQTKAKGENDWSWVYFSSEALGSPLSGAHLSWDMNDGKEPVRLRSIVQLEKTNPPEAISK